jgi:hypothetical protein
MTCAIGHREGDLILVDCLREIPSPFDPESVADEFAQLFKSYGLTRTSGDRYAAEWVAQAFEKRGIQYRQSELPKSDLYRNMLPHLNGKTIRLLDHQRCISQIAGLERRTARGGRDSIDHPAHGRDDVANAVAGLTYVVVDRHRPAQAVVGRYSYGGEGGWNGAYWTDGHDRKVTRNPWSAPCTIDFSKINKPPPDPAAGFTSGTSWVERKRG